MSYISGDQPPDIFQEDLDFEINIGAEQIPENTRDYQWN